MVCAKLIPGQAARAASAPATPMNFQKLDAVHGMFDLLFQ
jgi:hypothetical protein